MKNCLINISPKTTMTNPIALLGIDNNSADTLLKKLVLNDDLQYCYVPSSIQEKEDNASATKEIYSSFHILISIINQKNEIKANNGCKDMILASLNLINEKARIFYYIIENENLKNLLQTSLKDNEILNGELSEQKTLYEAQVTGINEKMEEFIRNRITEELKEYKNDWVKEKDTKDKLIEGQKKLINSLKDKVKTLTNDLKELTELKERESLVLSRLEKKGTEMVDIELEKELL